MKKFGKLYIVATPIGNLDDISSRALKVLHDVNKIYAEDTRVTLKLLNHFGIETIIENYHAHSDKLKHDQILNDLISGADLAIVSDAGTPGISDPGNELIDYLLNREPSLVVCPVPGPSSVTTALSASGFKANSFLFLSFLPKKKLTAVFEKIGKSSDTVVYFDSPHRVLKNLIKLSEFIENRKVFVARELTKLHETLYRGSLKEVITQLSNEKYLKGEFVVIVEGEKV